MLIKDQRLATNSDYHIKPLDFIRIIETDDCAGDTYMVIPGGHCDQVHMVSMSDGFMYDHDVFNHPIHLHNHLMKHYEQYELIKNKNIEISLTGPVQHIKKGGRW